MTEFLGYLNAASVELLHFTPLSVCSNAIRTCWSSFEKGDCGGEIDKGLIYRVGNIFKHASTLEHLSYSFFIKGISRALLQELSRHRIASLSVKSSRYTLKELRKEGSFIYNRFFNFLESSKFNSLVEMDFECCNEFGDYLTKLSKYIYLSDDAFILKNQIKNLDILRECLKRNTPNDKAKYLMQECYKSELTYTINARSLQNLLALRTDKRALREFQDLALRLYENLPNEHKFIFTEHIKK